MTREERVDELLEKLNSANQGMFSDPRSTEKRDIILAFADEIRWEACRSVRHEFKVSENGSDTIDRACAAIMSTKGAEG